MPCVDPVDPNFEKYAETKDLLCALCHLLESAHVFHFIDSTPGLRRWWETHKAEDALDKARRLPR